MNRTQEPATEIQLHALGRFGYVPDHTLTREEAAELLKKFQHPEPIHELTGHEPFHLRKLVAQAKANGAPRGELDALLQQRQDFWADTCRDVTKMHLGWAEIIDLYRSQGCRFSTPTREQVQEILDALDLALPTWDRDHPELFYQTLELNFPELVSVR